MRVLVVGAGAVGCVFYRAIEQQKGNELTFLLRAGRKRGFERFKILDARTGEMRTRERPVCVEMGQARPGYDTVLFCVRADQLAAALDDVGAIPAGARLATITPGPDGLALLRARHPGHAAVRIAPAFMAYADGDAIVTWTPPLVKTPVSHDHGSKDETRFAEELAAALVAGGVPARACDHMPTGIDAGSDAFMPLLAAYALSQYDADALLRDRALLSLVGAATGEALTIAGAPGFTGTLARYAFAPVVRAAMLTAAPRLPETFRAMWRKHAPKIERQTHDAIAALSKRAHDSGRPSPSLDELLQRLDARMPAVVEAPTPIPPPDATTGQLA